ncbi:hypothetical protein BOTBODRAFT_27079 [Botryobasidium botryosum FD-172 SS1]|uniref:Uncharacterized protein n=1 Tax=Botryobasidium botryosum (strain FD-172 SS1) TaxID=930990 RepID=A0A067NAB7_BOTB1|nr:hypothetical protein BOTBODRAFT_27079 [Botryobasidium botryosum FD-172 SS1]
MWSFASILGSAKKKDKYASPLVRINSGRRTPFSSHTLSGRSSRSTLRGTPLPSPVKPEFFLPDPPLAAGRPVLAIRSSSLNAQDDPFSADPATPSVIFPSKRVGLDSLAVPSAPRRRANSLGASNALSPENCTAPVAPANAAPPRPCAKPQPPALAPAFVPAPAKPPVVHVLPPLPTYAPLLDPRDSQPPSRSASPFRTPPRTNTKRVVPQLDGVWRNFMRETEEDMASFSPERDTPKSSGASVRSPSRTRRLPPPAPAPDRPLPVLPPGIRRARSHARLDQPTVTVDGVPLLTPPMSPTNSTDHTGRNGSIDLGLLADIKLPLLQIPADPFSDANEFSPNHIPTPSSVSSLPYLDTDKNLSIYSDTSTISANGSRNASEVSLSLFPSPPTSVLSPKPSSSSLALLFSSLASASASSSPSSSSSSSLASTPASLSSHTLAFPCLSPTPPTPPPKDTPPRLTPLPTPPLSPTTHIFGSIMQRRSPSCPLSPPPTYTPTTFFPSPHSSQNSHSYSHGYTDSVGSTNFSSLFEDDASSLSSAYESTYSRLHSAAQSVTSLLLPAESASGSAPTLALTPASTSNVDLDKALPEVPRCDPSADADERVGSELDLDLMRKSLNRCQGRAGLGQAHNHNHNHAQPHALPHAQAQALGPVTMRVGDENLSAGAGAGASASTSAGGSLSLSPVAGSVQWGYAL